MDTYQRYRLARDAAWRTLLRLPEKRLPADVRALFSLLRIEILPFPRAEEEPKLWEILRRAGNNSCVSLKIGGVWQVFLRENTWDESRERFALAHELGHMILHHSVYGIAPGVYAFSAPENQGDLMDDPQDMEDNEADMFAIRLLAPACVLHEMHLDTPGNIGNFCGLPPRAAAMRAERMELLNERDAFFTHPMERQVQNAFLPFIREKKLPQAEMKEEISPSKKPPSQRKAAFQRMSREKRRFYLAAFTLLLLVIAGMLVRLFRG